MVRSTDRPSIQQIEPVHNAGKTVFIRMLMTSLKLDFLHDVLEIFAHGADPLAQQKAEQIGADQRRRREDDRQAEDGD